MKAAAIIIAIILLLPASQQNSEVLELKVLSYNPTYEIWFFVPTGRPKYVTDNIKDAYWAALTKGGVCFTDVWFYCKTGLKIEE
ncbi:uncharacterized protein LOC128252983 [Drosophila gunungcola]|uniref:Uncharacterized protein n=1 Tax=Drosophila gunungcola TaxID=103775 RepID=A0A9P9YWV8_9MUSC|nr:uncharacterized protein LOC128252983 [Drosophila gunungcola]KAI8044258.1 hypothetical protein M5D96_000409 [Drosophila gunungcola]